MLNTVQSEKIPLFFFFFLTFACVAGRREPVHRLSGRRGRRADLQVGAGGFRGLARLRRLCHPVAPGPAHRFRLRLHPPHMVGHGQHQGRNHISLSNFFLNKIRPFRQYLGSGFSWVCGPGSGRIGNLVWFPMNQVKKFRKFNV